MKETSQPNRKEDCKQVAKIVLYIHSIMYRWDGDTFVYEKRCPFASFEEAIAAYKLHCSRVESRKYMTMQELWQHKLTTFKIQKGIPCNRPKRKARCQSY